MLNSIFFNEDWSPARMCHFHVIILILWQLIKMRSVLNLDDSIDNTVPEVKDYLMRDIFFFAEIC